MEEQNEQTIGDKLVQMTEKRQKRRSIEEKVGRLKYHEVVTKKILSQNERILDELRWLRHRLKVLGESDLDVPMLEMYAVVDQVDREILQKVQEAGDPGIFPKDVAAAVNKLGKYTVKYYDVSRRIVRMNKRLHLETGECLFEKRGHKWALTKFAFDVYGATIADLEESQVLQRD